MPNRNVLVPSIDRIQALGGSVNADLFQVQRNLYPLAQRAVVVGSLRPVVFEVGNIAVEGTRFPGLHAVTLRVQKSVDVRAQHTTDAHDHSRKATGPVERAGDMVQGRSHKRSYV